MENVKLPFAKKSVYFLEYLFLRAVALFVTLIPYTLAVSLGRAVGTLLFLVMKKRKKMTFENLRASFPEKSERDLQYIARSAFQNMAQIAIEFVCIPKLVRKKFIRISNTQNVWNSLKKGRGLILIVSHLTNWEVMAVAAGIDKMPIHAIGRPLKNPYVYEYVKRLRGWTGLQSVDKEGAIRDTVKLLKKNQIVCFLIDQHERQGGVRVNFFGRPCYSSGLPARIATKWDVPVVATFCYRDKYEILTTDFEGPFNLVRIGDEEADVQANTQQFVNAIERRVKERPGEWLWMHRRWRPEYDKK